MASRNSASLGLVQAADLAEPSLERDQLLDIGQEPGIDPRQGVDLLDGEARQQGVADRPDPFGVGNGQLGLDLLHARLARGAPKVLLVAAQAKTADFQPAQCLLKRLLEGPADRHDLAD